ncbi:plasmid partitioning protein RepB [Methylobacterium sp. NPDC080182]|uniref:plasmid partitioning protein RepB n=1 Tax=Methylobacterium sp. NPDC080182 TaxID=3390590 RepID=UPI003CFD2254
MNRKSNLDAVFGRPKKTKGDPQADQFTPVNEPSDDSQFTPVNNPSPVQERQRSGAIRAMSSTLRGLAAQADTAAALQMGSAIVELDTALIDDSFIADRVADASDPSLMALVDSLRESGQQVPVLVRPHPTSPERYQIAYGRRRTRAAQILKRPVRAVVRPLTDDELVVAQGKENLERRDLSFIERAFFARRLEEHGFRRETITAAMGVLKSELSTLISVARSVPEDILSAVGPAPAAGRPRWTLLAEGIKSADRNAVAALLADPNFQAKKTDERFVAVLTLVSPKLDRRPRTRIWKDPEGRKLVRIEHAPNRIAATFDETVEPGFADYVLEQLPELLAAYRARAR